MCGAIKKKAFHRKLGEEKRGKEMEKEALQRALTTIFAASANQSEALLRIYALFIPDWDQVEAVKGWPTLGQDLNDFIARLFIAYDTNHHPEVLPGGVWLNRGFSSSSKLAPWAVDLASCEVVRKEENKVGK
jgi:hypothetical protein